MVANAAGRITPHRAPPYEELDLSYRNLHICSQENQQKRLPTELQSSMHQIVCRQGLLPRDPTGGAYSSPQTLQLGLRGPISKGTGGRKGRTGGAYM